MAVRRRAFLAAGAAGAAGALGVGMGWWWRQAGRASNATTPGLRPDPQGVLDLPPGFRYHILERAGDPMDDGLRVPARADGMACFAGRDGRWILMRNHEVSRGNLAEGPYPEGAQPLPEAYDPLGFGGVSRVVIDPRTGRRVSSNLVLAGTVRNCAGGPSPWGWLSCEESELPGHGYVFLCDPEATRAAPPRRITSYGRFNHEAVAVDPRDLCAYLTEDKLDGCLYRMRPASKERPFEGTLQALAVRGAPGFDTGAAMGRGDTREVQWLDLPPQSEQQVTPLRTLAAQAGAALVRRGEGIWWGEDGAFFTATVGGPVNGGQVFHLQPTAEGGRLTLLAQAERPGSLTMPDNLTLAPWGELVVAEDSLGSDHLRVVGMDGQVRPFARNALSGSELAGVCFSPDGRFLFVNIQDDGLTLAITGPWPKPPTA